MPLTEKQVHDLNFMNEAARRSSLGDILKYYDESGGSGGVSLQQVLNITNPINQKADNNADDISDLRTSLENESQTRSQNDQALSNAIDEVANRTVGTPRLLIVNNASISEKEDGGLTTPYHSIQKAIDESDFGNLILIIPGEYDESITINNKENLTIATVGVTGQYRVKIDGNLIITGTSKRIGISNLEIDGNYTCDTTGGLIYADNVAVNGTTEFTGGGYHRYDFCFFTNIIHDGSGIFDIRDSQIENSGRITFTGRSANSVLSLIDVTNVCIITHTGGILYVAGNTTFVPNSILDSAGLYSTCSAVNGMIRFDGGTFLQIDGTYAIINKTGDCVYTLSTVVYEPSTSHLVGTRIDGGLHSDQIFDHNIRTGYSYLGQGSLHDHLDGISNEFSNIQSESNLFVFGDISSPGATLDLVVDKFTIRASYSTSTASAVSIFATTGTVIADVRRWSIYGGSSEGTAFDDTTLTTIPLVVDDTVLVNSSDSCNVWVGIDQDMWEIKVFISGSGARSRITARKLS